MPLYTRFAEIQSDVAEISNADGHTVGSVTTGFKITLELYTDKAKDASFVFEGMRKPGTSLEEWFIHHYMGTLPQETIEQILSRAAALRLNG